MEKVSNNIKFCTFINILKAYSNEDVSISIKEINKHMKKKLGITLDRRTMYAYIKDMRQIGLKVSDYDKEKEGYFLYDFFLREYELKLLMDSVKSSKFITKKKTEELLEKISRLNFIYRGRIVESNVLIDETSKIMNEGIYNNIDLINKAMMGNKKITFIYYYKDYNQGIGYNEKKDQKGEFLKVKPICILNNHENYYLLSIDDNYDKRTYYAIDKMENVKISEQNSEQKKITNL